MDIKFARPFILLEKFINEVPASSHDRNQAIAWLNQLSAHHTEKMQEMEKKVQKIEGLPQSERNGYRVVPGIDRGEEDITDVDI